MYACPFRAQNLSLANAFCLSGPKSPFSVFPPHHPLTDSSNLPYLPSHLQTTQWLEILQRLCLHDRLSVQHRGLVIAYNLLAADAELAKKLVESELLEILTVVSKQEPDEKKAAVVQTARECLIKCMDYGFIKPVS